MLACFRLARAAAMNRSKIRVQSDDSCYRYSEAAKYPMHVIRVYVWND